MNINETFDKSKKEQPIMSINLKVKEPKENVFTLTGTVKADKCNVDLMSDILAKIITDCVPEQAIEEVLDETAIKLGFVDEDKAEDFKPEVKVAKVDASKFIHMLRNLLEGV